MTDPNTNPDATPAPLDDNDPLVQNLRSKGLTDDDIASVLAVVATDEAKDAPAPAPAPVETVPVDDDSNVEKHETANGAVVEYDSTANVTSVEHSDGTRVDIDGNYFDVAVALSTLFNL